MATRFVTTHECDASEKFKQTYLDAKKEDMVIIKSPVGMPGRAIRNKFSTAYPAEIIAQTLRIFGEGMKVAVETVIMAADSGLIPTDKDVISIAGTSRGADTAIVLRPANSTRMFDINVKEIIAKPRSRA